MAKIKKKDVPKHLLVVDTNELWQETKNEAISEIFEEFWSEHSYKYTLELHIPEVVRGEILFQHTNSALKALNRANNQFKNMSRSANKGYKHTVTPAKIRKDVEAKIDKWIKVKSAVVVPTPIDEIDWNKVINNAVWRNPPFEEATNNEKGFRDAMILETLRCISNKENTLNIAFVSRDKLLVETATKELKGNKLLSCFESLEQLASYLKLKEKKLKDEFIVAIQKRASEKFYDFKSNSGVLRSNEIVSHIRSKFSESFVLHQHGGLNSLAMLSGLTGKSPASSKWDDYSDESIWIQSPEFEKIEGERTYHWSNVISFVQLFKYRSGDQGTLLSYQDGEIHIRIIRFTVKWKADVKTDGRFQNIKFLEVKPKETRFEKPSNDDIERYRLGDYFED